MSVPVACERYSLLSDTVSRSAERLSRAEADRRPESGRSATSAREAQLKIPAVGKLGTRLRDSKEHSFTIRARAQIPTEERQDVVLEAIGDRARMGTVIDLKGIGDAIFIENFMQLDGVDL